MSLFISENLIEKSRNYDGYDLYDIYASFSQAKHRAYLYCKDLCAKEGGTNFHITGHNCNFFTVAWDVENGVRMETAHNSYFIEY